jgi:hypothetical protein
MSASRRTASGRRRKWGSATVSGGDRVNAVSGVTSDGMLAIAMSPAMARKVTPLPRCSWATSSTPPPTIMPIR